MKKTDEETKKIFDENYRGDEESLQTTIRLLKESGCSQMESLKMLVQELNLSIIEADRIILNAKAWSSEKEGNLRLRDELDDYLGGNATE